MEPTQLDPVAQSVPDAAAGALPDPLLVLTILAMVTAALLVVFWPDRGLIARLRKARRFTDRELVEDALKHIRKRELSGQPATLHDVAGAVGLDTDETSRLVERMESLGLLATTADGFRLTPDGRRTALHIIRVHRLWERHLADRTGFPEEDWHDLAERREHEIDPAEADDLSAQLGHPTHDPHGDPIPDASGAFVSHGGVPLASLREGSTARIVHLEDEPSAVYAQLVAAELHPGMVVQVVDADSQRVRVWAGGYERTLAPVVAANVSVIPVAAPEEARDELAASEALSALRLGESATVVGISPRCRGSQRRRLLDLGVLPGSVVSAELKSPTGGSTAYRIRDALIALRDDQSSLIRVTRQAEAAR